MKTKIELDLKSVIVGAAATAVLIFGLGATSGPSSSGRYQIAVGGNGMAAIIDTTNGQAYTAQIQTLDIQANQAEAMKSFESAKN